MVTDSLYAPFVDNKYKEFSSKLSLTDTLPRAGVRIPVLRSLAKDFDWKNYEIKWHEDVMLSGLAIGKSKLEAEEKLEELTKLLPFLSSWDHTDIIQSAFNVKKDTKEFYYNYFSALLNDERVYAKRLGIIWLMSHRKEYDRDTLLSQIIKADNENEYYISMAVAWAFASFYCDDSSIKDRLPELSPQTEKRAKQKIRDSRRSTPL